MTTAQQAISNLADALAAGGRVSIKAVRWQEGVTVTLYHRGRVVDTPSTHPRERVEDAITDALGDLGTVGPLYKKPTPTEARPDAG